MTIKEFNKRLTAIINDDRAYFLEGEEKEEWIRQQKERTEREAEHKRQEEQIMDTWFEREEYIHGSWFKRLWLKLLYAIKDKHGEGKLPDFVTKEMARCLLPDIIAYCESEEGKAAFAKWKEEQEKLKAEQDTEKSKVD